MTRNIMFLSMLLFMLLSSTTHVFALDGKRKGFIIGVGAGGGLASYKFKTEFVEFSDSDVIESDRKNQFAIMTDFKLGYAPSNQVAIYWMSKVAWFSQEIASVDRFGQTSESFTIANGVGGLAVAYYFQPDGPSPYLAGGVGFSSWATPFEEGSDAAYGFGVALGAGYEFAKHWNIEGNLIFGSPNEEFSGIRSSVSTVGVRVTINVLGY